MLTLKRTSKISDLSQLALSLTLMIILAGCGSSQVVEEAVDTTFGISAAVSAAPSNTTGSTVTSNGDGTFRGSVSCTNGVCTNQVAFSSSGTISSQVLGRFR